VIAVAQLNRAVENRADNRPILADLRESGQIEQDADVIAFVYREEYYRPETPMRGIAEVIFRKHRDGAVGTDYLDFLPELTRFRTRDMPLPRPVEPEPETPRRTVVRADFKRDAAGDR
jgi:replicative DNA helicase